MNVTLTQTIPVGQTWIFEIEDGSSWTATSSSKYLLYELTNDNLVIIARKEAPDGAQVTLTKEDNEPKIYTLAGYVPDQEPQEDDDPTPVTPTAKTTIYYGSSSTVKNDYTLEELSTMAISGNSGSVTIDGNGKKVILIAIPNNWRLTSWKETVMNTPTNLETLYTKELGTYILYYDTLPAAGSITFDSPIEIKFSK